jgi:hypothetical protein
MIDHFLFDVRYSQGGTGSGSCHNPRLASLASISASEYNSRPAGKYEHALHAQSPSCFGVVWTSKPYQGGLVIVISGWEKALLITARRPFLPVNAGTSGAIEGFLVV